MKDRNYWLERGKKGWERSGYTCIGEGNAKNPLKYQLKIEENHIWMDHNNEFNNCNCGNVEGVFYYLTEQKFNELFPENKNMNRKFRIKSEAHSRAIQKRLFELGHAWASDGKTPSNLNMPFLFAEYAVKDITHADNENYFQYHEYTESTLDDLFEEVKPIKVKLNSQYTAVVYKDKIVVGCQEFTMEVFEELKKAVDKVKS